MHSPSLSGEIHHKQLRFLKFNLGLFSLILLATTWKLWIPQTLFPQVPLFSWVMNFPVWIDWLTFLVMTVTSVCILIGYRESWQKWQRVCGGLFFSAFLISITFDQHRIQPWAYQFALGYLILIFLKPPRAIRLFRLFVISIYFYSALSKCDASFVQTQGRELAQGLFSGIGISTKYWSDQSLNWVAASFPVIEFLIALGLFIPRTRRWALWAAVSMHICLMLAVGPFGLNHHSGVLIWNIYFICQDVILFGFFSKGVPSSDSSVSDVDRSLSFKAVSGSEGAVMVIAWFAVLVPLLEPTGYFDHWPAWGLYASHHDRVTLMIDEQAKIELPRSLQPFVASPQPLSRWCRVRTDRWSLAELGVPIYPQARFQLGVAIAVGKILETDAGTDDEQPQVKLLFEGTAHRLSGKRKISEHIGLTQIEQLTNRFWFNVEPRPFRGTEEPNLFR